MTTAKDIADWMAAQLETKRELYQEDVVSEIIKLSGRQFVYTNENGNDAIGKEVLKEFRKLTEGTVVWERGDKCWRKRNPYDAPGRLSD